MDGYSDGSESGSADSLEGALEALDHLSGLERSDDLRELYLHATESCEVSFENFEFEMKLPNPSAPQKNKYVEQLTRILNFIDKIWPRVLAESQLVLSWLGNLKDLDPLIEKIEKNIEGYNCEKNHIKKLRKHYGQVIRRAETAFDPNLQRPNLPQVPRTNPSTSSSAVAKVLSATATPAVNSLIGADAAPIFNLSGANQVNQFVSGSIFVSSKPSGTSTMSAENSSDEDKETDKVNVVQAISHNQYNIHQHQDDEEEEEEEIQYLLY